MAGNDLAIHWAKERNAIVIPFEQTEGNCIGTVSWWLRSRLTGKEIWNSKNFDVPGDDIPVLTPAGLQKARALQGLFGTEPGECGPYITEGLRKDKRDAQPKGPLIAATHSTAIAKPIADDCGSILECFDKCDKFKLLASIGIKATTAHALGLDSLKSPYISYFDPNLGEVTFESVGLFKDWWKACFTHRKLVGGAFAILLDMFSVEYFEKI